MAAVLGLLAGWVIAAALFDSSRKYEEVEAVRGRERAEAERAITRMGREMEDLSVRAREQAEVFQLLPELTRQMFAATSRRGVCPVAEKLVNQLFDPVQTAIFLARPADRKLGLACGRGLPASVHGGFEIDYGAGRVGYVAENGLTMDESDFRSATAVVRRHIEATSPHDLRVDVVAPIEDTTGLVGVIAVGGSRLRPGQEKRLIRLVAELAGLAMTYVARLRTVEHAAEIDGLTGCYNKRHLQRRLGDELHKAEAENTALSLFIFDIDHFKNYNDTNGHLDGDEVLKKIGELLRHAVREDDVVARYGGEEFVIVYPGTAKAQASKLAENLRRAIESHPFAHAARQPLGRVSISGGVAAFPEDAQSAVGLLRAADQALYEAKSGGRNRIEPARPSYLT